MLLRLPQWAIAVVLPATAIGCSNDTSDAAQTSGSSGTTAASSSTGTLLGSTSSTGVADESDGDTSTGGFSTTDGTTDTDGSSTDSGSSSGGAQSDSSTGEAGGLGAISGECGTISATEIESPEPLLFVNAIDFGDVGYDYELLTPGGQEVFDDGNLGGNSLLSEVIAFEVLTRCDGAELVKTETEIVYTDGTGPKTDLAVDLAGHRVGVSVTRAVAFPFDDPYDVEAADTLLRDKLQGVLDSSANVAPKDAWTKQILHIVAYGPMHPKSLQTAYAALSDELRADTIVVVTVTNGDDAFIYE